ncbi:UDP-galactose 4-epimerase, putative [Trypanosoma brucei gambiense DAL972]|uniref:UDP-glucose 4-epimerase n=3 Tax=Trypanosoma brucei TaxID=5691 RepID=D0A685_TRYB9|nr:UDP-galactose 4-epimerase, putative [Trypanosoma brucei gambiense DAL972]RHW68392.1 UDP-galactose 4-epimerase [Trypanosoma brucei equiperdum]CAD23117.1 UDP-galactose 4-epimerase [Trypanosoma brucei]CBH17186.1 UDP-galactose 4-epimerase, putative [Trypanosoma brucei gambiense DAL972]|eukprot:XP_011779450.1 UDP-galactose 4-epimerase, putative [Trypanosoma brucei gambiense DAL972]
MRVLVCGGAGYIGSHFVRALLRDTNHSVVIVDSLVGTHGKSDHVETRENVARKLQQSDGPKPPWADRYAALEVGDVRNEDFLNGVFTRHGPIDAVVHMCAFLAVGESVRDPLKYYDNNVVGILRLLQAMLLHKCDKIIFSSSAAIFGNPTMGSVSTNAEPIDINAKKSPESPYGESKLIAERMIRDCAEAYGIKGICLRYFNACGAHEDGDIGEHYQGSTHLIPIILGRVMSDIAPDQRLTIHEDASTDKRMPIFGTDYPTPDGTCVRDYVHVCDLASAHILALDYVEKLGPNDKSKYFSVFNLGTSRGYSVREVIEVARKTTGHPIPVRECGRREGDPAYLVAASDKAREVLGWKPKYDTLEAIMETSWKFQRTHPNGYASQENGTPGGRTTKL